MGYQFGEISFRYRGRYVLCGIFCLYILGGSIVEWLGKRGRRDVRSNSSRQSRRQRPTKKSIMNGGHGGTRWEGSLESLSYYYIQIMRDNGKRQKRMVMWPERSGITAYSIYRSSQDPACSFFTVLLFLSLCSGFSSPDCFICILNSFWHLAYFIVGIQWWNNLKENFEQTWPLPSCSREKQSKK